MIPQVVPITTPNGKVRLYLPQREYFDYLTGIQPIDGAVVVKPDHMSADRLFAVQLMTTIRYGRQEEEVMDVCMRREICLASIILNDAEPPQKLTKMQAVLKKTYGDSCFPFHIEWPKDTAASVHVEQKPGVIGEPCGLRHFIEVFTFYHGEAPLKRKRAIVDLTLTQLPGKGLHDSGVFAPPTVTVDHPMLLVPGRIQVDAIPEKSVVRDGEPLVINMTVTNNTNQIIKKIKVQLMQVYSLTFIKSEKKVEITKALPIPGLPVAPGSTLNRTVILHPRVPYGVAQERVVVRTPADKSQGKNQLAATTLITDSDDNAEKFGFVISYRVVIKMTMGSSPVAPKVVAKFPVYIVAGQPNNVELKREDISDSGSTGSQEDIVEVRQRIKTSPNNKQRMRSLSKHGMSVRNKQNSLARKSSYDLITFNC